MAVASRGTSPSPLASLRRDGVSEVQQGLNSPEELVRVLRLFVQVCSASHDQASGRSTRVEDLLAAPHFGFQIPNWSTDGSVVAVPCLPEGEQLAEGYKLLRVAVVDNRSGEARIVRESRFLCYSDLSSNGKSLAYCYIVRLLSGSQRQTFTLRRGGPNHRRRHLAGSELPLRYGSEWSWSLGSRGITYLTNEAGGGRLGTISLDGMPKWEAKDGPNLDWSDGERAPPWASDDRHADNSQT